MVHCNNIHGRSLLSVSSLLVLFMVGSVHSHTYFSSLIVNGVALPENDGMRPHRAYDKDYPLADVTMRPNGLNQDDMICGFLPEAARPANRKITVEAGSRIGLQWWHSSPGDEVIAPTHKGPCFVYMAKSDTGVGNVWFKIWEKGFDSSRRRWCVDDLIADRGVLSGITIPADISPGNYLLRGEIIGLHDAHQPNGAQPFVHCAELIVTGSGTANPPGVAIPGVYTDAQLRFDLYRYYDSYTIPGPAVYVPGTPTPAPQSTSTTGSAPQSTSTTGSIPQSTSTTGSGPSNDTPTTGVASTTGSSPDTRCRVRISQAFVSGWTEEDKPTTQYNVVMTNVGSRDFNLKFRLSYPPVQMWNLVANTDGTYGMPGWLHGALQPQQSFTWGYIVRSNTPLSIDLVVPDC